MDDVTELSAAMFISKLQVEYKNDACMSQLNTHSTLMNNECYIIANKLFTKQKEILLWFAVLLL